MSGLSITPETKVGELLEAYPELEETLVGFAPAFSKLKNPILRRTVARVATLAQAARVGGVEVRSLVGALRQAAGLPGEPTAAEAEAAGEVLDAPPAWHDEAQVVARLDADEILARGEHPLGAVQGAAAVLRRGEELLLVSGFLPAPLVDAMRKKGFETASFRSADGRIATLLRPGLLQVRIGTGSSGQERPWGGCFSSPPSPQPGSSCAAGSGRGSRSGRA